MIPAALPLKFLLVGDGALQGEMKQMLSEENEQGRVIFKGAVSHKEVPATAGRVRHSGLAAHPPRCRR